MKGDRPVADAASTPSPPAAATPSRRRTGSCGSTARGTSGGSSSTSATARSGSATGRAGAARATAAGRSSTTTRSPARSAPTSAWRPASTPSISSRGPSTSWATPSACRTSAPTSSLGMGNSLMGPNNRRLRRAGLPQGRPGLPHRGRRPRCSGSTRSSPARRRTASLQPTVKLVDYKADVQPSRRTGSRSPARSSPTCRRTAWSSSTTWASPRTTTGIGATSPGSAPTAPSASTSTSPARANGHFRIFFCFENGMVTGDGVGVVFDDHGEIRKSYRFRDGGYLFGD